MDKTEALTYLGTLFVSRETISALERYVQLLLKWNATYNLVGKVTESDIWTRHILDSAQLLPYVGANEKVLDVGTGAGLPGLVLNILGIKNIHLVESIQKKGQFLAMAARELHLTPHLHVDRLESIPPFPVDVITARAFASLKQILEWTRNFYKPSGRYLLLKGETWRQEIEEAQQYCRFDWREYPSLTHPKARLVELKNVIYSG